MHVGAAPPAFPAASAPARCRRSWARDACQFAERGQVILKAAKVIADRSRRHASGPPRDGRHADAALVQVAFATPQRAVGVEKVHLVAAFLVRAIVAGENYQRLLGEAPFAEFVQHAHDGKINVVHHPSEALLLVRPVAAGEGPEVRHFHATPEIALAAFVVRVRRVECQVQEEWVLGLRR